MKKLLFIIMMCTATIVANAQIHVSSTSNVGIGTTTPTQKLVVNGSLGVWGDILPNDQFGSLGNYNDRWGYIYANEAYFLYQPASDSDVRLKKDIKKLDPVLDRISKVQAVSYQFADNGILRGKKDESKVCYGFIAQDILPLFPETVEKSKDDMLAIRYGDFIPVLLQAIQEQQKQIEELQKQVNDLANKSKN